MTERHCGKLASAMEWLERLGYVHGEFASRKYILLDAQETLKGWGLRCHGLTR